LVKGMPVRDTGGERQAGLSRREPGTRAFDEAAAVIGWAQLRVLGSISTRQQGGWQRQKEYGHEPTVVSGAGNRGKKIPAAEKGRGRSRSVRLSTTADRHGLGGTAGRESGWPSLEGSARSRAARADVGKGASRPVSYRRMSWNRARRRRIMVRPIRFACPGKFR